MENSGDILSSLLQNPGTLKLIAGIAKSFLSANASTVNNAQSTSSGTQAENRDETAFPSNTNTADSTDHSESTAPLSGKSVSEQDSDNSKILNAAISTAKLSGGSNEPTTVSQSKTPDQPLNASAVIDAQHTHNSFDERANLLRSIKPYLKDDRQQKVDSLVKALNIAKLINSYTGSSGLFGK